MRLAAALLLLAAPVLADADAAASAYKIESTKGPLKLKKGAEGKAHVEVVPRSNAHVSPDAPISLTVSAAPGLKVAKARLGRTDAKETEAKGVSFDVPFTADSSGELKSTLSFFICTEKLCEKQKAELALMVQVE